MTTRNAATMGEYATEWQSGGYSGSGRVVELVDTLRGRTAVVCGNGVDVFQEFYDVSLKFDNLVIFAANDVGMYLDRLDHWVTLHSDNMAAWKSVRWLHYHAKEETIYHGVDERPFIDYVWSSLRPLFALSGYFAMQLAHIMSAEKIILCGCPGTQTRRFFENQPRGDFGYGSGPAGSDDGVREQLEKEMQRLPDFKAKVRSMSGWTRDFFGGL